ncbi:hypothetical protein ACFQQB_63735 [Nonomuraea rubra]|uniref:hypothetical protein n=1 Tax=Nonomuraea rubra TaxID=46180 RepID=UPI00360C6385
MTDSTPTTLTTLTTLPASAAIEETIAVVEAAGAVIIEDFIDSATLDGLWEDLGPALAGQADGDGRLVGEKTRILPGLVRRSARSVTVMRQPHLLGLARHFLQRPVRAWLGEQRIEFVPTIQLGISRAIQIQPGVAPRACTATTRPTCAPTRARRAASRSWWPPASSPHATAPPA